MGLQQLRSTDKDDLWKYSHYELHSLLLVHFCFCSKWGKTPSHASTDTPSLHDTIPLKRELHIQREQDETMAEQDPKKATLYVGADIWQHVKTQQTSDLCAACTHPYSQVKMDKMSSFRHSRGEGPPPPPANLQPRVEEAGVNTLRVMPFAISPTTFASQRATAKCQHSINSNNSNGGI